MADAPVPVVAPNAAAPVTGGAAAPSPITYKFDVIEGIGAEFDTEISTAGNELGWNQEQAAAYRAREAKLALADLKASTDARGQQEAAAKLAHEQTVTQTKAAHEKANRDHPEFGGTKYDETTQRIEQLIASSGEAGQALIKEMGDHAAGLLNTPTFRAFLATFAYKMADGKFHDGANGIPAAPRTFADVAYGDKYASAPR